MTLSLSFSIPSPTDQVWSVGQLSTMVKHLIDGSFMPVWVRGEISDFKHHRNGHWYFCLRDRAAQFGQALANVLHVAELARQGVIQEWIAEARVVDRHLAPELTDAGEEPSALVRAARCPPTSFRKTPPWP
jgi:hypothetical protein